MYSGHVAELCILLLCVVAFFGYHIWLYNFENPVLGLIRVPTTMAKARQVWTRSICADDKDVITGVQTIRNSLMTVTLFTVAAGYIGARAIPEILLTPDMIQQLNLIQVNGKGPSILCPKIASLQHLTRSSFAYRVTILLPVTGMALVFCSHRSNLGLG